MNSTRLVDGSLPLAHWGLIRARGADALVFLQGQLTNDVVRLEAHQARLAGFCSAKGRLQASFVVWKLADDDVLLACAASVLPVTLKRLSMFVMRAKCKLSDAAMELALIGVAGSAAAELIGDTPVWGTRVIDGGSLVRLPDVDGLRRALAAVEPASDLASTRSASRELTLADWRVLEVKSGIPLIEAETVDRFVPQMINFELIDGVDFRKGCYPGQEIVARSQYRGTIKRRMFLFESANALTAGQEVFHELDATQPAGMVVNAAPTSVDGTSIALIEVKLAALSSGSLLSDPPGGSALKRAALPYDIPIEDATAD